MASWDTTYEAQPGDSDNPQDGNEEFNNLKVNLSDRLKLEHNFDPTAGTVTPGGASGHGWHRAGSAVSYAQSAAPTTRPDGSQALDSSDAGRIWLDTDTNITYVYTGTAWVGLTRTTLNVTVAGTLVAATDIIPPIVVPWPCDILSCYLAIGTAPTGQALIVDINHEGSNSIFSSRPQIAAAATTGNSTSMDATYQTLAAGEKLTVDIDQVGSSVAGANLGIVLDVRVG